MIMLTMRDRYHSQWSLRNAAKTFACWPLQLGGCDGILASVLTRAPSLWLGAFQLPSLAELRFGMAV